MSIVCGIDFSPHSRLAVRAASALARRLDQPLRVVHVAETPDFKRLDPTERTALVAKLEERLQDEATILNAEGVVVGTDLLIGSADEELVRYADRVDALLLVIGSVGRRDPDGRRLGKTAERLVAESRTPVLVVRDPELLTAWAKNERPLSVYAGFDLTSTSDGAMHWLGSLRRAGPCDVTAVRIYFPALERGRVGIPAPVEPDAPQPELEALLKREMRESLLEVAGDGALVVRLERSEGRPAEDFVRIAADGRADVLVVGTHQRSGLSKVWHGSFALQVLHASGGNVLCVPRLAAPERDTLPSLSRVLVVTDFSELGNEAVPYGYRLAGRSGTVHLATVVEPRAGIRVLDEMRASLKALVPEDEVSQKRVTRLHVVHGGDVALAITQLAERLGVDVVCMASHGRSGVSKALFGSVAEAVLQQSSRPVFVVRGRKP